MRKPWLYFSPKLAHDLAPIALKAIGAFGSPKSIEWRPKKWRHFIFQNPLGIAGGVDKNAEHISAWYNLGLGFVEVGTVTPQPQSPNPGKILDRDLKQKALWNKMGFPSKGADVVFNNLKKIPACGERHAPVFVNIGKNRNTANEKASDDYTSLITTLHEVSDGFVVNISSPNTSGLRELQKAQYLETFLSPILKTKNQLCPTKPVLLKLSPDLDSEGLATSLLTASDLGIDGFVLTNTTLKRPYGLHFPLDGGVSGKPLAAFSEQILKDSIKILGSKRENKLIISVGGIYTVKDLDERFNIGADLAQIYSALVFEGPQIFSQLLSSAKTN